MILRTSVLASFVVWQRAAVTPMHRNVQLSSLLPLQTGARAGRSVVAVIGIDRYTAWPRLYNAVSDATGAARLFEQLGFVEATPPLLDGAATVAAMHRLVTTGLAHLAPEDSLVLFFAGHGHTHTARFDDVSVKTGYIIPADAAPPGAQVAATWLRLDSWLSNIARLPPRHILVMIDACHSGVALSEIHKWRGEGGEPTRNLDALRARRSRRIITSALDDQRAMDGGPYPGHSLFTGCLIEGLSGGLAKGGQRVATGTEIGQYLQTRVSSYPHTSQTPDFGAFELDGRGDIVVPILGGEAAAPDPITGTRALASGPSRPGEPPPPAVRRTQYLWIGISMVMAIAGGAAATLATHNSSSEEGVKSAFGRLSDAGVVAAPPDRAIAVVHPDAARTGASDATAESAWLERDEENQQPSRRNDEANSSGSQRPPIDRGP